MKRKREEMEGEEKGSTNEAKKKRHVEREKRRVERVLGRIVDCKMTDCFKLDLFRVSLVDLFHSHDILFSIVADLSSFCVSYNLDPFVVLNSSLPSYNSEENRSFWIVDGSLFFGFSGILSFSFAPRVLVSLGLLLEIFYHLEKEWKCLKQAP